MIKRRYFLLGGAAAALGAAWYPVAYPQNMCDIDIDEKNKNRLKGTKTYEEDAFWKQAYKTKPFTLVGETNHTDPRQSFFFYSMRNIDYMQAAGVKNIFLEGSPRLHKDLLSRIRNSPPPPPEQEYEFSNLNHDQRKKLARRALMSFWAECEKRGMNIHSPDNMDETISPDTAKDFIDFRENMVNDFIQRCGSKTGLPDKFMHSYGVRNIMEGIKAIFAINKVADARDDDRPIVNNILGNASTNGNVIFYGAGHLDGKARSIKNLLGYDNIVHIGLYGDKRYYLGDDFAVPPDFAFLTDEKKAYQTGHRSLQDFRASLNTAKLTLKT